MLAGYTGLHTGVIESGDYHELVQNIRKHAADIRRDLAVCVDTANKISEKLYGWRDLYVASSGINYPVVLEVALKLKETSIIHAEGVQLGELRHGPIVLVKKNYQVIIIKPVEESAIELYRKVGRSIVEGGNAYNRYTRR